MPSSQAHSLHQTLPWTVFQQVGDLLKQMVESDDLIVTEEMLSSSKLDASRADRYVVVVSSRFSALLQGQTVQKPARSHSAPSDRWCQIRLTFDPREIAIFLTHLEPLSLDKSALLQQFKQVKQSLQPNDPERQSQFTLRLAERLTPAQDFVIGDSWQQVEQERLLNEVTMLTHHSLELPVILETAVHQVRQFLQVDRLIIYQFNIPTPLGWVDLAPDVPFLWQTIAPNLDGIIYESRDNDRESHSTSAHFLHRLSHQEQAELV
ncbi:MAG: hypothetical protein LH702_28560, partial [Phormidesmis sp. CAN_BIN44]|nr:hypothetical protein [Phormidesmis sp. CAN_BIN44]